MINFQQMSQKTLAEFADFMTGKHLGGGMSRQVYAHPTDKTKVIKIEDSVGHFQNALEWEFWNHWSWCKDVAKWLAPCHSISACGTFLIMERTEPLRKAPEKLPQFLTDHKPENYGLLKGRVVCHDYGRLIFSAETKLKKWTGEKI